MPSFFFRGLQRITVLLLICDSYMNDSYMHEGRLSKTACGIFHFRFCFVFIKVHIFAQEKAWVL